MLVWFTKKYFVHEAASDADRCRCAFLLYLERQRPVLVSIQAEAATLIAG